mgnify:CR=1 FL=1
MELRNLNSFLRITELGSFTKAARELGYATSTITAQIHQLEEEIKKQAEKRHMDPEVFKERLSASRLKEMRDDAGLEKALKFIAGQAKEKA